MFVLSMLNWLYCVSFSVDTSAVCLVVSGRRLMRKLFALTFLMTTLLKTVCVNYGFFAPLPVHPLAYSPSGSFAPWLVRPLARSPPGLFAPNVPGGESARSKQARGRTSQGARAASVCRTASEHQACLCCQMFVHGTEKATLGVSGLLLTYWMSAFALHTGNIFSIHSKLGHMLAMFVSISWGLCHPVGLTFNLLNWKVAHWLILLREAFALILVFLHFVFYLGFCK